MKKNDIDEMESLNLDDLDVEELERRLEMAPVSSPICTQDGGCDPLCKSDWNWLRRP